MTRAGNSSKSKQNNRNGSNPNQLTKVKRHCLLRRPGGRFIPVVEAVESESMVCVVGAGMRTPPPSKAGRQRKKSRCRSVAYELRILLTQHLRLPVLLEESSSGIQLLRISDELDVGILFSCRQFCRQIGWYFPIGHQLLIARRMGIALQIIQLSLIGKNVLDPQTRSIGMRCSFIDNGHIGSGDRTI